VSRTRDGLVASGLSNKTIKDANLLAALKNRFSFAVTNKLIAVNTMAGITVKVKARTRRLESPRRKRTRQRGSMPAPPVMVVTSGRR